MTNLESVMQDFIRFSDDYVCDDFEVKPFAIFIRILCEQYKGKTPREIEEMLLKERKQILS